MRCALESLQVSDARHGTRVERRQQCGKPSSKKLPSAIANTPTDRQTFSECESTKIMANYVCLTNVEASLRAPRKASKMWWAKIGKWVRTSSICTFSVNCHSWTAHVFREKIIECVTSEAFFFLFHKAVWNETLSFPGGWIVFMLPWINCAAPRTLFLTVSEWRSVGERFDATEDCQKSGEREKENWKRFITPSIWSMVDFISTNGATQWWAVDGGCVWHDEWHRSRSIA